METDRKKPSKSTLEQIASDDRFARLVGAKLLDLQPGFASATLEISEHNVNIHQMAHGGAIFTLADLACEALGNSFGIPGIALQMNIQFLSAGKLGDLLTATAKLISRTDSFAMLEYEVKNHEGRLLSTGQQTIIFKKKRNPS